MLTLRETSLALLPGANFRYYTGIEKFVDTLTCVLFLPAAGSEKPPTLLLPAFEHPTVEAEMPYAAEYVLYERNEAGYREAFVRLATVLDLDRAQLGVESIGLRFQEFLALQAATPGARIESADAVLTDLRLRKSPDEIEALRTAARITERALEATLNGIRPGMTEIDIRNSFLVETLRAGADGWGFDPIVVSGPRTALQHPISMDRTVQSGDPIIFDIGARYRGYTADITRTVVIGRADGDLHRIYEIVLAANEAGRAAVQPGVSAEAVDRAAREVIERSGFGETFTHGTGHGLGLDVHEPPRIAAGESRLLEPGMVFTIEPGIYRFGQWGVRIEDDVAVTRDGVDCLTAFRRDLIEI